LSGKLNYFTVSPALQTARHTASDAECDAVFRNRMEGESSFGDAKAYRSGENVGC
jgi:hypothetical protein